MVLERGATPSLGPSPDSLESARRAVHSEHTQWAPFDWSQMWHCLVGIALASGNWTAIANRINAIWRDILLLYSQSILLAPGLESVGSSFVVCLKGTVRCFPRYCSSILKGVRGPNPFVVCQKWACSTSFVEILHWRIWNKSWVYKSEEYFFF